MNYLYLYKNNKSMTKLKFNISEEKARKIVENVVRKALKEAWYGEQQTPEYILKQVHSMRSNILSLPNGDYVYVDYNPETNELIAGGATNSGIIPDYSIEYDVDFSLDENLQALYDKIIESGDFTDDWNDDF